MEAYLREKPEIHRRQRIVRNRAEANLPALHLGSVREVLSRASGEWMSLYSDLIGMLDTGFMVALVGSFGGGKTQLAVCVAKAALDRAMSVRYYRAMDYFIAHRACYGDKTRSEPEFVALHREVGLLILDEAHQRSHTAHEDATLNNILDHRYGRQKPTILISNETPEAFAKSVGYAVVDRLYQCGGIIECNWPSHRSAPEAA
jgi:DNA replication protein DnaC